MTYEEIEDELREFKPDTNSDDPIPLFKEVSITKKSSLLKSEYRFKMVTNKDAVSDTETMSASELMTVFLSVKMPGKVTSHKVKDNVVNITLRTTARKRHMRLSRHQATRWFWAF